MSETPASAVEKDRIERAMRSTSLGVSDLQVQAVVAEVESIVRERLNAEEHTVEKGALADDHVTWTMPREDARDLLGWLRKNRPLGMPDRTFDGLLDALSATPIPPVEGGPTVSDNAENDVPDFMWRGLAETLIKATRWDEWKATGWAWQGEQITLLAQELEKWLPESEAFRFLAQTRPIPTAEGGTFLSALLSDQRRTWEERHGAIPPGAGDPAPDAEAEMSPGWLARAVTLPDFFDDWTTMRVAEPQPEFGLVQLNVEHKGRLISVDVKRADLLAALDACTTPSGQATTG